MHRKHIKQSLTYNTHIFAIFITSGKILGLNDTCLAGTKCTYQYICVLTGQILSWLLKSRSSIPISCEIGEKKGLEIRVIFLKMRKKGRYAGGKMYICLTYICEISTMERKTIVACVQFYKTGPPKQDKLIFHVKYKQ